MKILMLCDVLFPQTTGGAGRVAREVARALKKMNYEVQFLTRFVRSAPPADDIETTYFPPPGTGSLRQYRDIFNETVRRFQPDVIHIHQPLSSFLSIPSSFSRPIVYNFYSPWAEEWKIKSSHWPHLIRKMFAPLLTVIERSMIKRSAAVVVLSEYSLRQVSLLYDRPAVLIPGGVDPERFQPAAQPESDGSIRLVTLRNLVPRMGLNALIRAMRLLPSNFQLTVGGEGPLRSRLEELVGSLGLGGRVRLVGHVPDGELPRFYSSAHWFVLPTSALEGFGLIILESLACGTPVLGTRIGAIPELLERFDPRWVIEQPTPEAIAASIASASSLQRPRRWELHGRVAEEFNWERIGQRYGELFAGLFCLSSSSSLSRSRGS